MSKALSLAVKALTWVAVLAIFGLMSIVTFDVIVRNVGVTHVRGMMDYVSVLLLLAAGATIPVAFVINRHLVVELGTYALTDSAKMRLEAVWLLLGAPLLLTLSWLVWHEGVSLAERGQRMGTLGWSPIVFHGLVAASMGLGGLACLLMAAVKGTGRRLGSID
ncbi:TRAP transporter small permease [Pseudooceanicola sp.]|uniref:TRAP transporter small permease n=1 Tax=Pseudooceanicola sp. TaxID=1914328 RepID=UPI004058AD02